MTFPHWKLSRRKLSRSFFVGWKNYPEISGNYPALLLQREAKQGALFARCHTHSVHAWSCCFGLELCAKSVRPDLSMPSAQDMAKRTLVQILKAQGRAFGVNVTVTRESPPADVTRAYRAVARKVHPDKPGGRKEDFQKLSAAHNAWADLLKAAGSVGRPPQPRDDEVQAAPKGEVVPHAVLEAVRDKRFRVRAQAVLLTYQGVDAAQSAALQCWARFLKFVKGNIRAWGVKHWTATLETNKNGAHHLHLMIDFYTSAERTAHAFSFEDRCPNVSANDLLGEGWSRSKLWQVSVDRGHFYVWANKKGTVHDVRGNLCVAANYEPAWTDAKETYVVKAEWPEKLWKAYKLDDQVYYRDYLFQCKDKIVAKKRNFEAFLARQRAQELEKDIEDRTTRIRSTPALYQPFGWVAQAAEFLALFDHVAMRYPVLLVHAPSYAGKSEWAVSLFKKPLYLEIGASGLWPPGMKQLDRAVHDGLVLDDLRDLKFLHDNQEKLQGKYNRPVTLFNTPGGELACTIDLYRLPIIFTVNNSTKNLDYLVAHDFCSKKENVRLLCFRGRPGQSLVTDTLPEDGEEKGAWERFVSEVLEGEDEGEASCDPYM